MTMKRHILIGSDPFTALMSNYQDRLGLEPICYYDCMQHVFESTVSGRESDGDRDLLYQVSGLDRRVLFCDSTRMHMDTMIKELIETMDIMLRPLVPRPVDAIYIERFMGTDFMVGYEKTPGKTTLTRR